MSSLEEAASSQKYRTPKQPPQVQPPPEPITQQQITRMQITPPQPHSLVGSQRCRSEISTRTLQKLSISGSLAQGFHPPQPEVRGQRYLGALKLEYGDTYEGEWINGLAAGQTYSFTTNLIAHPEDRLRSITLLGPLTSAPPPPVIRVNPCYVISAAALLPFPPQLVDKAFMQFYQECYNSDPPNYLFAPPLHSLIGLLTQAARELWDEMPSEERSISL
ncbi:hypothetical protein PAPYR_12672 [Paratrimastix pyriformis]|uniref:Uncharacterized protein n=1 Tax=Paratrimastix pyriformis TaxID=342808 RepID=A0ABQ8U540_9EUKA|nr:hypothetical protein PAPYR_12672 [Paratrimastix pyriformis]